MAKLKRYYTDKNIQFMSHSELEPRKLDLFLYASIPFVILYQYQCVVQPDTLNYGTIRTCLSKGLCISMRDYKETTTGYGSDVRFTWSRLKNGCILLPLCEIKTIHEVTSSMENLKNEFIHSMLTCYFGDLPHMLNGGSIPLSLWRKPIFCEY